jgi:hypothetical protein
VESVVDKDATEDILLEPSIIGTRPALPLDGSTILPIGACPTLLKHAIIMSLAPTVLVVPNNLLLNARILVLMDMLELTPVINGLVILFTVSPLKLPKSRLRS